MSAGFTEQIRTVPMLALELDKLNMSRLPDLTRLIKLLWAEKFKLPPNDERLLSLTLREAAEQIFEKQAFAEFMEKRAEKEEAEAERDPEEPQFKTRTDPEAQKLADTPHLIGDPEWDAVELAETDPTRPPLSERMSG